MDYNVFDEYKTIPKDKMVTVVDIPYEDKEHDMTCSGIINVFDYYEGNRIKGTLESYDVDETSNRILNYPCKDEIYVHRNAVQIFEMILYSAKIFTKGKKAHNQMDSILLHMKCTNKKNVDMGSDKT